MSQGPLDLNSLPPELRRVVEQQLAKLPPAAREKLLREGSPLVAKMLAKMQAQAGGPPPLPGGRKAQEAVHEGFPVIRKPYDLHGLSNAIRELRPREPARSPE